MGGWGERPPVQRSTGPCGWLHSTHVWLSGCACGWADAHGPGGTCFVVWCLIFFRLPFSWLSLSQFGGLPWCSLFCSVIELALTGVGRNHVSHTTRETGPPTDTPQPASPPQVSLQAPRLCLHTATNQPTPQQTDRTVHITHLHTPAAAASSAACAATSTSTAAAAGTAPAVSSGHVQPPG